MVHNTLLPIILVQQDLKLLKNVEALATLGIYAQNEAENIVELTY